MSGATSRASKYLGAAGAVIFAVYCLFVFIIFDLGTLREPSVFWMSFAFMCLAFAAQLVGPGFFAKRATVETVFFGIPVASLGLFYFFAELFASAVFMAFQGVGWKAALLVQVALLAVFLVAAIVAVVTQGEVQKASESRRIEATVFKSRYIDIQTMIDRLAASTDGDLKKQLTHLSETVRYSDPFGRPEQIVQEVEGRIELATRELESALDSGNVASALAMTAELENLYSERRRKLMLVK